MGSRMEQRQGEKTNEEIQYRSSCEKEEEILKALRYLTSWFEYTESDERYCHYRTFQSMEIWFHVSELQMNHVLSCNCNWCIYKRSYLIFSMIQPYSRIRTWSSERCNQEYRKDSRDIPLRSMKRIQKFSYAWLSCEDENISFDEQKSFTLGELTTGIILLKVQAWDMKS